jgi:hypothetical protein
VDESAGSQNVVQKWSEIWRLFSREEQLDICICLFDSLRGDSSERWTKSKLVQGIAKATKFRTSEIERLFSADAAKLANMLVPRVNAVLDETLWERAFRFFYFGRRGPLMCMFLDSLGMEHSPQGGFDQGFVPPSEASIGRAVLLLSQTYSEREIGRYLAVLVRGGDGWGGVLAERNRLLGIGPQKKIEIEAANEIAATSDRFTVLDRTIIKEIVRSVSDIEGALNSAELEDLVATVTKMNEQWHRAYFHLGLMDVLLPVRNVNFDRPEYNDRRRNWYLAGVMAGLARSHAIEQLHILLAERKDDFDRAVKLPGDAGAAIARTSFRFLVEAERIGDALKLLQNQVVFVGLSLGREALDVATDFIRQRQYGPARQIVDVLRQHRAEFEVEDEDDEHEVDQFDRFKLDIDRRFGQCLQAQGDFEGAERAFKSLQQSGEEKTSTDLLADLGLVKGKFPSLTDVKLPDAPEQRSTMKEALTKGEPLYRKAIEQFGAGAPKACYALALLEYIRWSQMSEGSARDAQREKASNRVVDALTAIQVSDFEQVYKDLGALGQCQFMQAVLKYNSYDAVQGREAMASWLAITEAAGQLPGKDLRMLLDAAELHDSSGATEIAESIWRFRKDKALDILGDGPWIARSPYLHHEILGTARNEGTPRSERVRLWCSVIPGLNRSNDIKAAEEGLDALEMLAEDAELARKVLAFISEASNVDPAWRASEAAWARFRLLRKLNRDAESALVLRELFFMVRDTATWEAEQIVAAFEDWNLDESIYSELTSLLPQQVNASAPGVEERLASGERVSLLFIGGNEIQARYDADVRRDLAAIWSGVDVVFEHTGWSSNWGRELDRLTRSANSSDAVVLMPYMRTMLGRRLRESLEKPWIPCTSTGKGGMGSSLRRAAVIGLDQRLRRELR